ncbi:MAG: response regulator transcription factor [Anaerolineaceae bacterium]|jgi:DNA-binding response OmpR family regulator|nr:response regulator transcription factor [Anaerolineaceae bacterium]MDD4043220.1 response regulator transcription factor [Anaerolineaceae bacterium]MDD4577536.1 response regulator transcription factor [Anaerolineaceae bacterium]
MTEKILVVDDEVSLQETLTYSLEKQGYQVEVAGDGLTALELARTTNPDLIILDVMLPGMDGFEVCRTLRHESNIPVLMLTARDDEIDRVVGLEVGADDYLPKPFSMRELIARVKALLRRVRLMREEVTAAAQEGNLPQILTFGNLEIDMTRREVRLDGEVIPLKPKEYELLTYMGQHKGRVLTREMILEQVWGWGFVGDTRTVDVHVRWLREKIEEIPEKPERIITVRGAGYRFEG